MDITPLPAHTSSSIRSALVVPSYPQILSELIQNSLDAGSTSLEITLGLTKGNESIRVKDDGCGISEEGLKKVGKRYRTSKTLNAANLASVGSYGFRGEALSSLATLSLLTISSKTNESDHTYTKILKSGKTIYFGVDPSRTIDSINDSGTVVTVKEIFHDIPVRRKELKDTNEETLLRQCKRIIEVLALSRPGVKWLLWDEKGYGDRRTVLDIKSAKSSVQIFRSLYGNALAKRVQSIRVSAGSRRVDGFISLFGDVAKSHQHLYINNYPLNRSDLHLSIARRFATSKFGTYAMSGEHDLEDQYQHTRQSPRRLERHPIYVLNVTLPPDDIDASFEPAKGIMGYKDYGKIQALLLAVVDEFLKKNGYERVLANTTSISPTKQIISPDQSHGKSPLAKSTIVTHVSGRQWDLTRPAPPAFSPIVTNDRAMNNTREADIPSSLPSPPPPPLRQIEQARLSNAVRADHGSRDISRIATQPSQASQWITDLEQSIDIGALPHRRSGSPSRKRRFADITCTSDHQRVEDHRAGRQEQEQEQEQTDILSARPISLERSNTYKTEIQLSKTSLAEAKVIGQVDKKFIAALVPKGSNDKALVLIDQHAADERISVERVLHDLCAGFKEDDIPYTKLKHVPSIILTLAETRILRYAKVLEVFRRWGVHLDRPEEKENQARGDYTQIEVRAVPTVFVGRLGKKEGVEMTRLIRGYLPVLEDNLGGIEALIGTYSGGDINEEGSTGMDERSAGVGSGEGRGKEMRFMPKEMLELANSKACRGAIMFQDTLSADQQSRLVSQLATTDFPFMCAHGRPSMIPLIAYESAPSSSKLSRRPIDWTGWKNKKGSGEFQYDP
ncbi:uncharacterized protein I303_104972 [Kwoniella dejecticola CBS 10117]|uniref:MutL C-terminal dimerisation domain-containing protein n=1 Tax=Kwoniella dejecticola CBS 10117 TaxID=1296121 RepID=A0A1A6A3U0_9TREE|nr:uncharacterized protein I303_05583 [Kwoniella dejecticola CBS 10117]OBR84724.1 hypothetical protein I303_05583 [Kwoniella dejecticola CBS 10117]